MGQYSLPAECRVKTRKQIQEIQRKGDKLYTRNFLVIVASSDAPRARFAVTVTRKIDKRAVVRNRIKRRLRELFRLNRPRLAGNFDILVIARKNAADVDFAEVQRQVLGTLHHHGYLRGGQPEGNRETPGC